MTLKCLERWGLVLVLITLLAACNRGPEKAIDQQEPGLVHVVLVWLKEPGNLAHRQQIIEGSKMLRDIPGVLDLRVGEVVTSDRAVVEDSYDVGLYLRLADQQALDQYLIHPTHKETVKREFLPIMERYQVLDFRSE